MRSAVLFVLCVGAVGCGLESAPVGAVVEPPPSVSGAQAQRFVARPFDALGAAAPETQASAVSPVVSARANALAAPMQEGSAPTTPDALDAGADQVLDAGVAPVDSGCDEADAGSGPVDSTTPGTGDGFTGHAKDAGTGRLDAGSTAVDAGTPPVVEVLDAGLGLGASLSVHLSLGLPSPAAVSDPTQWLLVKPQYVSAYDTTRKAPRWVSWEVSPAWFGSAPRSTSFRTDAQLPAGTPQAVDADYVGSGFDRGHLCPSADRTTTIDDNKATFVFTNVVPQTHESNAGPWETLETDVRTLAVPGKHVFVVAGPVFGATKQTIGAGVEVPLATFKVAVVLDEGAPVTTATRVIAIVVPNTASVSGSWRGYRTTVRDIEQATGLDLLSDVPRAVQDVVETRLDAQ